MGVDVKVRYANHYGLKGAFVWEVDTDNFMGFGGKQPYNILHAINDAIVGGAGLEADEILGNANDNKDKCTPAPFCDLDPSYYCDSNNECNDDNSVVCDEDYSNCFWCNMGNCDYGCSDDQNCPDSAPMCNGDHRCQGNGVPAITTISVSTSSCASCSSGSVEEGLQLDLVGKFDTITCSTNGLDNSDQHDYGSNYVAQFNSTFLGGNDDHGLGHCNNFDLKVGLDPVVVVKVVIVFLLQEFLGIHVPHDTV